MRIAIAFPRPNGGQYSHFAHFVCDFALPCFSVLRSHALLDRLLDGRGLTVEINARDSTQFGPLQALVQVIFPGLLVEHVSRFTLPPLCPQRSGWGNKSEDLEPFVSHLKQVLPITASPYGVIIVARGLDRSKYPGGSEVSRSGAERRNIGSGLERLVAGVTEKRSDTTCVVLEHLPFAEQVSLFLAVDTLIAQHGAAFSHAHWMPPGGTLIELQCSNRRLCPGFVPALAKLRGHRWWPVSYPCLDFKGCFSMQIGDVNLVSRLLRPRKAPAAGLPVQPASTGSFSADRPDLGGCGQFQPSWPPESRRPPTHAIPPTHRVVRA